MKIRHPKIYKKEIAANEKVFGSVMIFGIIGKIVPQWQKYFPYLYEPVQDTIVKKERLKIIKYGILIIPCFTLAIILFWWLIS